jgi:hypothetical protein
VGGPAARPAGRPGPATYNKVTMTSDTRAYVEQDLAGLFAGEVRYARDAPLAGYAAFPDERALFLGPWGLRNPGGGDGPEAKYFSA